MKKITVNTKMKGNESSNWVTVLKYITVMLVLTAILNMVFTCACIVGEYFSIVRIISFVIISIAIIIRKIKRKLTLGQLRIFTLLHLVIIILITIFHMTIGEDLIK